jgi:hypothetical protein
MGIRKLQTLCCPNRLCIKCRSDLARSISKTRKEIQPNCPSPTVIDYQLFPDQSELLILRLNKVCKKLTSRFLPIRISPVLTDKGRRRARGCNRLGIEYRIAWKYLLPFSAQRVQRVFGTRPRCLSIWVLLG